MYFYHAYFSRNRKISLLEIEQLFRILRQVFYTFYLLFL